MPPSERANDLERRLPTQGVSNSKGGNNSPIETLLSKLSNIVQTATGWSAQCPSHDDRRASLSIGEGDDGTALVKCHAGCDTSAVLAAIGLQLPDLFTKEATVPKRKGKAPVPAFKSVNDAIHSLEAKQGKTSAIWTYHDGDGEPVGVVVRWDRPDGKDIRPISKHSDGWRIGAMASPKPVYQLPKVEKADLVIVAEGEKAADAARALGFTATTSAGGANAAKQTDWRPLAGKEVIILPDNDIAGRKYAEDVAGILSALEPPAIVRVAELPNLPDGGDIVEWIDSHGEAAEPQTLRKEIESLAQSVEPWRTVKASSLDSCPGELSENTWPQIRSEAFHGLAGEIVRAIEPHSEADPIALLIQMLVSIGSIIGRTAHFRVEGQPHYLNLFAVLVGKTSKGRKGTSWGRIKQYLAHVDDHWLTHRVQSGLVSGEGMIHAVRDPVMGKEAIRLDRRIAGYQDVEVDAGEPDKRLLCIEEEYANVLRMLERQGNSLSARIREAWQGSNLGSMTKNASTRCKEPHIGIIGHVTDEEIRRYLTATESANGFGNRHLWLMVRRSKVLPEGGDHEPSAELARRLYHVVQVARKMGELKRDDEARKQWNEVYGPLSEGRPGLTGCMIGRAEAQVMRLSCLYAVMDQSPIVKASHLKAALALWDYCEASVRTIFGNATGDEVAETIYQGLRRNPDGLSRTQISELFGRNKPASRIDSALSLLLKNGMAAPVTEATGGAPRERWKVTK